MKKIIFCILIFLSLLLSLCACGAGKDPIAREFDTDAVSGIPSEALIAENNNFRLEWDEKTLGVILTDLATGKTWSSTPGGNEEEQLDEWDIPIRKHPQVNSVLLVTYLDYQTNTEFDILSYTGAIEEGRVRCAKGKDSLLVEFYFDEAGFMIPVEYKLFENSVRLRIDPSRIQEGENKIVKISLAPFMCSAENDSKDTYLFVPSGSGALVDTSTRSQQGTTYSASVFGTDLSMERLASTSTEKSVRMPVFGARMAADKAVMGIIDGSADSALIEVKAGSVVLGYTSVYVSFQLRGYTDNIAKLFSSTRVRNKVFSKRKINTPLSVSFYPLTGENADYNGMARLYRDYLDETVGTAEYSEEAPLNVTFIGGTMVMKSFLGVPYKSLYPATILTRAGEIVDEISRETDSQINITLKGYGSTGLDVGKIGGGFEIGSSLGTVKQLKKLSSLCNEKAYSLYMDFELNKFNKSSSGFSTLLDASFNTGGEKAAQYHYNISVRDQKKNTLYYHLTPSLIGKAGEKAIQKTEKWGINGISIASVSSESYSDYADKSTGDYYSKSGMSGIVTELIEAMRENDKAVLVSDANAYAAARADIILDTPTVSSGVQLFKCDVPFYSMVFGGRTALVTESLNLAANADRALLNAVESGCGLSYTITGEWSNKLINSDYPVFYNSVYEDISQGIISNAERLSDYYKKIAGAAISSHFIHKSNVRETVFENGVRVLVNYSEKAVVTSAGEIPPRDFIITEGAQ